MTNNESTPSEPVETPPGEPAEYSDADDQPARTPDEVAGAVEALLLMAEEPIPAATMAAALAVPVDVVSAALQQLRDFYDDTGRGFELRHLGGGWRYYTRAEHADVISAYVLSGQQSKLSQAALETLAVIAYRQPISRARVSAVRGVNVDGVVRTLLARNVIAESGQDSETGAVLFVTTDHFLERMGLDSLDDLPPLAPHLPEVADMEAELADLAGPSGDGAEPVGSGDSPVEPVEAPAEAVEAPAEADELESDQSGDAPVEPVETLSTPIEGRDEKETDD